MNTELDLRKLCSRAADLLRYPHKHTHVLQNDLLEDLEAAVRGVDLAPGHSFLADMLIASVENRAPDFVIGDPGNPYMRRWWLRREHDAGSIYLHQILRDDDDRALHDHPWDSASIILSGELIEVLPTGPRLLRPGSITCRVAEDAHRLAVKTGPVWSLFITGKRVREWGFHCPQGWRHWREFTDPATNGATVGRGCA